MAQTETDRLAWWREARFGLFIHWGLYALPAGIWQGRPIPSLGEWIMRNAKIPIEEYERLAESFNPVEFDAEAWVSLAKRAGMRYIVITAKHHDGFAMYHSPSCAYNIVDATPFGRDPMAELAEACRRHGIRLCFYYSQAQDWHAPGGAGHWEAPGGENWHGQTTTDEAFAAYLEAKVVPQVTELLTQYGPIGLIWFDTPVVIKREQSEMLRDLVHRLQPDCLVSGRVGHGVGDYGSMGDNQIPRGPVIGDWETPATMNDTWGYKRDDHHWKSVKDLLYLLVDLTSKGVNYLLNVGPTAEGRIPEPSVERLEAIGRWMDVNGEAIYGTSPNPWPFEFTWGRVTRKGDRLFLLVYEWPEVLDLSGLRTPVRRAALLADPFVEVPFEQTYDVALDHHRLRLTLPAAPDPLVSVIALQLDGELDVDTTLCQQPSGVVDLPAYLAERRDGELGLTNNGVISGWRTTEPSLSWRFRLLQPGRYQVRVILGSLHHSRLAGGGPTVRVDVAEQAVRGALTADQPVTSPRAQYFPEAWTALGEITLDQAGWVDLALHAEEIPPECRDGLTAAGVELHPVG